MAEADFLLEDGTVVRFEVDEHDGFRPAGAGSVVERLEPAIGPLIDGARLVIDRVKSASPQKVEVRFGVKVSGSCNWVVARGTTDANFSITLTWEPRADPTPE